MKLEQLRGSLAYQGFLLGGTALLTTAALALAARAKSFFSTACVTALRVAVTHRPRPGNFAATSGTT